VGSGVDVSTRGWRIRSTRHLTFHPVPFTPNHTSNSIRRSQGDIGCGEVSLESGVGYFASCRVQLLHTAWGEGYERKETKHKGQGAVQPFLALYLRDTRCTSCTHALTVLYAHALDFDRSIAKARDPRSTASGKEFPWSNESRQGHHADITLPKTMRGRSLRSPVAIVF
jgi:hypothetical protein